MPLATREIHSAINHRNNASFRITAVDYTTGRQEIVICFTVSIASLPGCRNFYAAPVMVLIFVILLPNIFFAVTSS